MAVDDEIGRWATLRENQFFERKSAFDRSGGRPKQRNARAVAWDIAETLSAMANADGGELVIGLENEGDVTGVPQPEDKLALLRRAPGERQYVLPSIRYQTRDFQSDSGKLLLH